MTVSMPPVINKRRKDIDEDGCQPIAEVVLEVQKGPVIEPSVPALAGKDSDSELNRVN